MMINSESENRDLNYIHNTQHEGSQSSKYMDGVAVACLGHIDYRVKQTASI